MITTALITVAALAAAFDGLTAAAFTPHHSLELLGQAARRFAAVARPRRHGPSPAGPPAAAC